MLHPGVGLGLSAGPKWHSRSMAHCEAVALNLALWAQRQAHSDVSIWEACLGVVS